MHGGVHLFWSGGAERALLGKECDVVRSPPRYQGPRGPCVMIPYSVVDQWTS
jgi:hypothetical protein